MAYIRIQYPKIQAFDDNGNLAVGYEIHTYTANTSTPVTTYSNRGLSVPNANPVILDARGECEIYTTSAIKLILTIPGGNPASPIWSVDYVGEIQSVIYNGATVTTTGNVAAVTGSPTASALANNMMLVYIPDSDNVATMGATGYSVTALNDCVFTGPYTGTTSSLFRVEIDGAASSPDTFKWRKDVEAYTTGVSITGADQTLKEGVKCNFAVLDGHTNGDYWTVTVTPPYKVNLDGLGAKLVYKNSGGSLIPLENGDIKSGYPIILVYSVTNSCWMLINTADYTAAAESATNRVRYEKSTGYTLTASDHGNEISFIAAGDLTLTLPAAATLADKFFYVRASAAGNVTIDADGSEVIYSKRAPAGAGTYILYGSKGDTCQIGTNGIDWHIMTESPNPYTRQIYTTSGSPHTWTKTADLKNVLVHVYAGGGGGKRDDTAVDPMGGGGGGYAQEFIAAGSLGATETVTVGAGGTGGTAGSPLATNGGDSSFGAHCSATGGASGGNGGGVGDGSGGDINLKGQPGSITWGGAGAGPLGGKIAEPLAAPGNIYGGGGAGNTGADGKAGGNGLIIVEEFR